MKNSILACLVLLFSSYAIAQKVNEKDIPAIVKSTFLKSYPNQNNVKWEKLRSFFYSIQNGTRGTLRFQRYYFGNRRRNQREKTSG
jgi:hypothetical protein